MRVIALSAIVLAIASPAAADQVTISNKTESTIYRLYAWPTDLIARTFNILDEPLDDNTDGVVNIDNSYQDCAFTFQFDQNNPTDLKKLNYRRKPLVNVEVDICATKDKVVLAVK